MELRPVFPLSPAAHTPFFEDGDPSIRNSLENRPGQPIVVVKFSGWGTLLGLLPFFENLRTTFPDNPPILVTNPENRPMIEHFSPWLTVVYRDLPQRKPALGAFSLALCLRRIRPALFIDLQIFTRKTLSFFLSRFSGSPIRIGFVVRKKEIRSLGLTHPFFHNRHFPASTAIGQISRFLGLPVPEETDPSFSHPPKESEKKVRHLLRSRPLPSGKTIVLNPNTSGQSRERRWPTESYTETARMILERHPDLRIVLTGVDNERALSRTIRERIPARYRERMTDLTGRLSFSDLHALLRLCDGYLGNDSGPLHLALAEGIPAVGLFGPTHPDLILGSRRFPKALFLYEPHYCSPCLHQADVPPCGGDNVCMQSLTPASVVHALEHLLWGTGEKSRLRQVWSKEDHTHRAASTGVPLALYRQRDEG